MATLLFGASFQNYLVHFEDVENAIDVADNSTDNPIVDSLEMPDCKYDKPTVEFQGDLKTALEQWFGHQRYRQPKVTLATIADQIGSNRTYLSQYINSTYGCTFREWINSLRIEEAKKMISQETEMSITLVSTHLGYSSSSQFIRLFSEQVGVTPAQWRKQNQST